jgi:hypothetical protein
MRPTLALVAGITIAFASAAALGEYPFTGLVPYAAGVVVPALILAATTSIDRPRPTVWWPAAAVLGAGGVALGVWFSGGRGLDPWPAGGTVAVVLAAGWPLAGGARQARRRRVDQSPTA